MSVELAQLEANYHAARRARDRARREVSKARAGISELAIEVEFQRQLALETQAQRDQQAKHANTAFRKRKHRKGLRKVAKRNQFGDEAKYARMQYELLLSKIETIEKQAEVLARRLGLYQLNVDHVIARHRWMARLAEEELPETTLAKQNYAKTANVPREYADNPSTVWLYCTQHGGSASEIHIFYGGATAPPGEGMSPDGYGHAHHILVASSEGALTLDYARYLDGSVFRRGDEK